MVLSLSDICLRSIMDRAENGTIKDLHRFVPPKFRQRLLDMVLARQKIDNPIWIRDMSSAEYLRGFLSFEIQNGNFIYDEYLSFSTQRGRKNDDEYLNEVANSILEDGESIRAEVKKLKLNLYTNGCREQARVLNRGGLVRLIGQCSNLKLLDLRWKCVADNELDARLSERPPPILSRVESLNECRLILENLDKLSLWGHRSPILVADHPIIAFNNLSSLRLIDCSVDEGRWKELLKFIQNTLTYLRLTGLAIKPSSGSVREATPRSRLPIPLPHLKFLKIEGMFLRCSQSFFENLRQCQKLEYVCLDLEHYGWYVDSVAKDEEYLTALNRIDAQVEVKICIRKILADDPEVIDVDSRFKMVSMFNEKITHLDLYFRPWNDQTTLALKNIVADVCHNLTSFKFESPYVNDLVVQQTLDLLFIDQERAAKFRKLELNGDVKFKVKMSMSAIENFTKLDSLKIYNTHDLIDEHLIRWADRGGRPSELVIICCSNVNDEGLIPVLVSSGDRLKTVDIGTVGRWVGNITDRTWRILIDHCPNVERVQGMPSHLWELAKSKCLNIEL